MARKITNKILILMLILAIEAIVVTSDQTKGEIKMKPKEKNRQKHLMRRSHEDVSFDCRIDYDSIINLGEDITIKRSWSHDGKQWLGPLIDYEKGQLIGVNERIKFHSDSKQDEASIMDIVDLNDDDRGFYYCYVWSITNSLPTIISKNETIEFELILAESPIETESLIEINSTFVTQMNPKHEDSSFEHVPTESGREFEDIDSDNDYYSQYDEEERDLDEEEIWTIPLESEPKFVEHDNENFFFNNVTDMPSSMRVEYISGHMAKLRCPLRGHPNNTNYTWYKNSHQLKGLFRKNGHKMEINKWKLNLENLDESDSANYTCHATNPYGSYNFTFDLNTHYSLRHPPVLMNLNVKLNNTILEGENITFDCRYQSSVNANFSWFRVYPNNTYRKIIGSKLMLDLHNVTMDDSGNYSCIVSNPYGTIERYFYLNVVSEQFFWVPYVHHMLFIICATLIFITLLVTYAMHQSRMEHNNKKITIVAQKSFIIKKKIILKNPIVDLATPNGGPMIPDFGGDTLDAKQAFDMFSPLVKIDYEHILIDSDMAETTKSGSTQYEIPLDDEWEMERAKIYLLEKLGEGEFGTVIKGEIQQDGDCCVRKEVAIKMLKDGHSDDEIINLISEMEVMKRIGQHRNIINLIGCCTQNGPLYVIVEYAPYGNLRDFLRKEMFALKQRKSSNLNGDAFVQQQQRKYLTFIDLVDFAFQVARGMAYLASKRCVHRDLAARNVLVCEENVLKIADFGLARRIQGDYYRKTTNGRLPIKWMAIESLENQVYTTQSDVWSFGILIWEIMTLGRTPYPGTNVQELWKRLEAGYRMEKPVNCDDEMYSIMRRCWNKQPNKRPSFVELVKEIDILLDVYTNKTWSPEYAEISFQGIDTLSSSSEEDNNENETTITTTAMNEYDNDRLILNHNYKDTNYHHHLENDEDEPRYKNFSLGASTATIPAESNGHKTFNPQTVLSIGPEHLPGKWFNMNTSRYNANHHYINGIALRETLRQQYDSKTIENPETEQETQENGADTNANNTATMMMQTNQTYMNNNNETMIINKPLTLMMNKCYDLNFYCKANNHYYPNPHPKTTALNASSVPH